MLAAYTALLLLVAVTFSPSQAEDSVLLRQSQYDQFFTSSTLQWIPAGGGRFPNNSVVGATEILPESEENEDEDPNSESDSTKPPPPVPRSAYVCRGRHNGVWVPGSLHPESGVCHISLLGDVSEHKHYQVLQNMDGGARLSWITWDRFHMVPMGAVSAGEMYVARRKVQPDDKAGIAAGYSHYVGKLDAKDGLGRITVITQDGEEKGYTDGEILKEIEPVRYELTEVKFNLWRKRVNRQKVVLATSVLRNGAGTVPVEVDQAMQYSFTYSLYWGQGRAMLKALPTTVRHHNGNLLGEIKWGIEEKEERRNVFTVKHLLEPGTAVNVTLLGNNTDTELYYNGNLVAIFDDGASSKRAINGSRREVNMMDLVADYGPVYFIKNGSLVPTTTTTTTSTTSTTTTTTTGKPPVPVPEPPVPPKKPSKAPKPDLENEINRSGMLADEALSLQKENASKQERGADTPNGNGRAGTLQASTATFLAAIVASVAVVQRIT